MSAVKSSKVQVGISTNPDNNFVVDASQADGSFKISRGNIGATTQELISVSSTGIVSFPSGSLMLGVGQTWQNMSASRAAGTTYTNNTGKPIKVSAMMNNLNATNVEFQIDGVTINTFSINANPVVSTVGEIVPAGATYRIVVLTGSINKWFELR